MPEEEEENLTHSHIQGPQLCVTDCHPPEQLELQCLAQGRFSSGLSGFRNMLFILSHLTRIVFVVFKLSGDCKL